MGLTPAGLRLGGVRDRVVVQRTCEVPGIADWHYRMYEWLKRPSGWA
ncbi:MAG TPA: hypothetical protein VMZ31_13965 [Phycisphaerae bacterium]|nr:hypothetical protein [Phycisphaerae bacterium]